MPNTDQQRPNILYIMSDQHTARVMGCADDPAADTPHLDQLATSGIRFNRAYCPSPVCLPSRMSMLTGLRPHEQECWTNDDILNSAIPTWLHGLGAAGYRPVLVGRMHALGPDQLHGYTERLIGDHSPAWPGVARRSLGVLNKTSGPFRESIEKSGIGQSSYQLMDDDVLDASVKFLKEHAASPGDEPFCLTTSFMLPHPPYVASEEDYAAVQERVQPPGMPQPPANEHPWIKTWRETKRISEADANHIQRARCAYYALVRRLDRSIGTLLNTLEEIGEKENTLVIYVSDHGDHIGERGLFWKHTFYEDSVTVPLILSWPGHITPQQVCQQAVETGGLGNTILSLVNAPEIPNTTMTSFAECIRGDSQYQQKPIFIEYCTDDMPAWAEGIALQQRAIIQDQYKYIVYGEYHDELFDVESDPNELNNLIDRPEFAALAKRLKTLVLTNWDQKKIAARMEQKRENKLLLKSWAEQTAPADQYRWNLQAEQNYLND